MSIRYTFTAHGTIRIECDDDMIEVRIPAGGGQKQAPQRDPDASPTPDSGPHTVLPKQGRHDPEPPTVPGVMSIISSGRKPLQSEDLFSIDDSQFQFGHIELSEFASLDPDAMRRRILEQIASSSPPADGLTILEVNLDESPEQATAVLTQVQKLLKDGDLGVDALRLWHNTLG